MIADSHGVAQTVYVRHRDVRYNAWKPTQQTDSVDDVASIRLRGLSSGTEYIAEASLDNSFPDGGTRSVTFTTKEREDDDDGSSSVGGRRSAGSTRCQRAAAGILTTDAQVRCDRGWRQSGAAGLLGLEQGAGIYEIQSVKPRRMALTTADVGRIQWPG